MAVFDEILSDVDQKFNLSGKATNLLSTLLTIMTDEQSGALRGFIDLFRRVGLGLVADSWVSAGANTALSNQQLEDALGGDTLGKIASRAGLPAATATPALAYLIPLAVDALTPDGVIPSARSLTGNVSKYLASSSAAQSVASGAASNARVAAATSTEISEQRNDNDLLKTTANVNSSSPLLRLLLPLLLLGLLVFLSFRFCGGAPNRDVAIANVNRSTNANIRNLNSNTLAVVVNSNNSVANSNSNNAVIKTDEDAARAVREANERARTALGALGATSSPQEIINALNLSIVNFAKDSADIPEENKALLEQAAAILKNVPSNTKIEIGGHTDSDGDDAHNLNLSEKRANAVRAELVRLGVNSNVLTARGFGEAQPRATNETPDGRFQNRRIEYTLTAVSTQASPQSRNAASTNINVRR